MDEDKRVIEE